MEQEHETYEQKAKMIIELAEGLTHVQWNRINHLIERTFEDKEAKITFEKPKKLDRLLKQNFID